MNPRCETCPICENCPIPIPASYVSKDATLTGFKYLCADCRFDDEDRLRLERNTAVWYYEKIGSTNDKR